MVVDQGDALPGMWCLLEGTIQTQSQDGDRFAPVGHQSAPTWAGAIAVLTEGPLGVRLLAMERCRFALIPADEFRRLALASPPVHRRIMHQIRPVMSRIT